MKRKLFLFTTFLISVAGLFAFEPMPTEKLLLSYLQNDIDLKKLTIAAEKANLSYKTSEIDSGIDVTLSTGTLNFKTSKDGLTVKTSPTVKVNIPQASGLSISANSTISSANKDNVLSDSTISVGVDIISPSKLTNDINMMNAERTRTQAIRNLEEKAIDKEKAFYTEIKSLLNSINSIIQAEKKLYTDIKDFETIQAKGFSKTSSTYRLAEIQVSSDKQNIESLKKTFINDYVLFYKKCGYQIELSSDIDVMTLIPTDIIAPEPVNIESYDKNYFKELENAKWTYKINSMKRDVNHNFSLSANAGYTFDNSMTKSDTLNIGASSTIGGVNLQAGINIPIKEDPYPSFTFSAGVTPNAFRKNNVKKQQDELTEQQELLDIKVAENNYDNFVTSSKQTLEELYWRQKTTNENFDMYSELEKDMKEWFELGVVSESEYLSAKTNANLNKVKSIINDIDFIIYNDDINKKFIKTVKNSNTEVSAI